MRTVFLCLLALALATSTWAETLTFEGKAGAQVVRSISVPFPILVDALLVKIGDDVQKDQRLLEYHLDPRDAKAIQYELLSGGEQMDLKERLGQLDEQMAQAGAQRATAAELAAKGLGSQAEAGRNARIYGAMESRRQVLNQKSAAARTYFGQRLEELQSYFGHSLKMGQKLPEKMYLTAPIAATVVEVSPQARPGAVINANVAAVTLAVLNPIQVQIQVYESEITRLEVGQEATIEVVNKDGRKLPGRVSMLSWQPTDSNIAVPSYYFVYIDVDNPEHLIKPGYKVRVSIEAK